MRVGPAVLEQGVRRRPQPLAPGGGANGAPEPEISPPPPPRAARLSGLLREIWEGCWAREEWSRGALLRLLVVLCFATLCSWAGIALSRQSEGVATIWLSNGVIFGLLITQPPRRWLPYFVAGLCADTLADVLYGDPFPLAFGVSLANAVEVVTSALTLAWLFGSPFDLSRLRSLLGFLGISVFVATAFTSALGASWTLLFQDAGPWLELFRTWWLGDLLGMAILAPLCIMLQRPGSYAILRPNQLRRTLLVLLVPAITTVVVFTHSADPLIFLLSPAVLLVAFRLGYPGTVLAIVLVTLMAIGFTVKGYGPLMLIAGQHMLLHRIVVAQVFSAVSIFTMFPIAALLEEQDALKVSLAASEARFRQLAQLDELTGLANRRAFNLRLAADWETALSRREPISLLLLDADHFKQYNDVFGHLKGDDCLRVLAGIIAGVLGTRPALTARYGGEEFAVLLAATSLDEALRTAESIRTAVADQRLPHPTGPFGVQTVSVGVATLVPQPGQEPTVLVREADQAMYCAKIGGRNQIASV